MLPHPQAFLTLSLVVGAALFAQPANAMTRSKQYTDKVNHLGAFYIKDTSGGLTVYCSGTLISNTAVLSSCYCLNEALQMIKSKQGGVFFGGELHFAMGQMNMEPAQFNALLAAGSIYDTKIDYSNIKCPPGVDLSDTTNFPNDLAVVSIPAKNIATLGFTPAYLAVDDEPLPDCIQPGVTTYLEGYSSSTSCDMNVNISSNYVESTILECDQTDIFAGRDDCDKNVFCTKQDSVLLTLGDSGGPNMIELPGPTGIQFGVISYQYKMKPYGTGCTLSKRAQLNTRLKPFGAWIRQQAPTAKYVSITYTGP